MKWILQALLPLLSLTAHAGEEVFGRVDRDRLRCRRLERSTGSSKPGTLVVARSGAEA